MYLPNAEPDSPVSYVLICMEWYSLLLEELSLCAKPDAGIIAVGGAVAKHLERRGFPYAFTQVIHYSNQAGPARNAGVRGRESELRAYRDCVGLKDVAEAAEAAVRAARAPEGIRDEVLAVLTRSRS